MNRLRGTIPGANNRMDLRAIVTSGVNDNEVNEPEEDILVGVVEGWQDDETHNPDVPAISHKRGLTPFVFVPFEEVPLLFSIFTLFSLLVVARKILFCVTHHDLLFSYKFFTVPCWLRN